MVDEFAEPEFARPVVLEEIGHEGLDLKIEAAPDECARLAARFNILSLECLAAQVRLAVMPSGVSIRVSGRFQARFAQECVVSLEPVESEIDESLVAEFGPVAMESDILVSLDGPDPAEPLVDGGIDLGELVVQHLALALDLHPRKSGAQPPDWAKEVDKLGKSVEERPFSALATLRKKDQ